MESDSPPEAVPFYRRGGFWLGVASVVPLLIGVVWVLIDQHGRTYAADIHARMAAAGYRPGRRVSGSPPVPAEQNFGAHPLIQSLVEENRSLVKRESKMLTDLSYAIIEVYPRSEWHGPQSPCLNRTWGTLGGQTYRGWSVWWRSATGKPSPVAQLLQAACPEAPRSTVALGRYLEAVAGTDLATLEARLDLPGSQLPDAASVPRPWHDLRRDPQSFSNLVLVLAARGQLALENDEPARAVRSVSMLLRLATALDESVPRDWICSHWGRGVRYDAADIVWLAARDRRWSDAEWQTVARWAGDTDSRHLVLTVLQQRLGAFEPLWLDNLRSARHREYALSPGGGARWWEKIEGLEDARVTLVPYGWFVGAVAHVELENWIEYQTIASHAPTAWPLGITRPVITEGTAVAEFFRYSRLSRDRPASPWSASAEEIGVWTLNHVLQHFMRVTAALERWHGAHGHYPESLVALVPSFLDVVPTDLDGAPLRYARESRNDRYRLWSVALNGTDDGGRGRELRPNRPGERRWSQHARDWVWQYP